MMTVFQLGDTMNSHTLLDFSQFITNRAEPLIEATPGHDVQADEANVRAEDFNRRYYYGERGFCPFCRMDMKLICTHNKPDWNTYGKIWSCPECGFWEYEQEYFGGQAEGHIGYQAVHHQALVRRFDVASATVPLRTLHLQLRKDKTLLYDLHPTKMEELVQGVFASYYSCEVIHCGCSHDGGVDLIMIDSDEPTLVQVKRRQTPHCVEPVTTVREFLGAMFVCRARKGIFVSTADHFSPECEKSIRKILHEGTVTRFELVNFEEIANRLRLTAPSTQEPWKNLLSYET
jgi:hypothetical protein